MGTTGKVAADDEETPFALIAQTLSDTGRPGERPVTRHVVWVDAEQRFAQT